MSSGLSQFQRLFCLDYFAEHAIGINAAAHSRNIRMERVPYDLTKDDGDVVESNPFALKLARNLLEGRDDVDDAEGIWPTNFFRCERRFGHPRTDVFSRANRLADITPEILAHARGNRCLAYWRIANAREAKEILAVPFAIRYASEVTTEWYDPPGGLITVERENPEFLGTHAVEIYESRVYHGVDRFFFNNWWGGAWGWRGKGAITAEHFDRFLVESWFNFSPPGVIPPLQTKEGTVCLEWKYSINDAIGVHGREIVDAATHERLAWALCKRRGEFLDVEEFFVWPDDRERGYGRELARMVLALARSMNRPLRLLVSFADTLDRNRDHLETVARLLGVNLFETDEKWVHLFGTADAAPATQFTRRRPRTPACVLEYLRPVDEKPNDRPTVCEIFFGTNRQPEGDVQNAQFGPRRATELVTGRVQVTIPVTHRFGCNGRWWQRAYWSFTRTFPRVTERRVFENFAESAAEIAPFLAWPAHEPQTLLFIHGFNVTFDSAMLQAAQFAVDLKVPGPTFCFSWPSAGKVLSYAADEATIEAAVPYLDEFISLILDQTGNLPLNVLVHSMGNRAMVNWLLELARNLDDKRRARLRNVIFAAPDVDTEVFTRAAADFLPLAKRTTLYATNADVALLASDWLHTYPRAGLAPPIVAIRGLDTIFVDNFDLLALGHSYFATASTLLYDMWSVINCGTAPHLRRALRQSETQAGLPFWRLSTQ